MENKDYQKKRYHDNIDLSRQKAKEKNQKKRDRNKQFIYEYLLSHHCIDCGEKDPVVLEFDHVRGTKIGSISDLSARNGLEKIQKEMEKCDIRCANCHRRKTAKQFNYYSRIIESEIVGSQ